MENAAGCELRLRGEPDSTVMPLLAKRASELPPRSVTW